MSGFAMSHMRSRKRDVVSPVGRWTGIERIYAVEERTRRPPTLWARLPAKEA